MNQIKLGFRIKQCLKTMFLPTLIDISSVLNASIDYLLFGTNNSSSVCSSKEPPYDSLNLLLQNLSPQ